MIDKRQFLEAKFLVPSELRTAQWRLVPASLKEKIFFMAGVTSRPILEAFRSAILAVAHGEVNLARATEIVHEGLNRLGYKPEPGQEGTIKDLNNIHRQLITLRTNLGLARGWMIDAEMRAASRAFPGRELMRGGVSEEPRPWLEEIWPKAVRDTNSNLDPGRMVALHDDPIWLHLSDFGATYTPLKWGSEMTFHAVKFSEAKELGILPPPGTMLGRNRAQAAEIPKSEGEIRAEIAGHLAGVAEWSGDVLVFSEPNGTTVRGLEELAQVLTNPPGELSASYQLCALWEWRALGASEDATVAFRTKWAGRSILDDFNRLATRVQASDPGADLVAMLRELVAQIERMGFT